jgi:hypothetical protein
MSGSVVADVVGGSGWSIGGYDVKESPDLKERPDAARFVKQRLRDNVLEPASKAEFDEIVEANKLAAEAASHTQTVAITPDGAVTVTGIQENKIQEAATEGAKKLATSRKKKEAAKAAEEEDEDK